MFDRGWMLVSFFCIWVTPASGLIVFHNDAPEKGLAYQNTDVQSVAWVDFNGDGWLDLWLTGHHMTNRFYRSKLYLNESGEGFSDVWPSLHSKPFDTDAHGIEWIDWDSDGDQDLFVVAGGGSGIGGKGSPSFLFSQDRGSLVEKGSYVGLSHRLGRGRMAYWFDDNNDGELDVFVSNSKRPDGKSSHNQLYHKKGNEFIPKKLSETVKNMRVGQAFLSNRAFPNSLALPLHRKQPSKGEPRLWMTKLPWRVVTGDFDGDAILDYVFYIPTNVVAKTCYIRSDKGAVLAFVPKSGKASDRVFRFRANGPVKLNIKKSPVMELWRGESEKAEKFGSRILSLLDDSYLGQDQALVKVKNGIRIISDHDSNVWTIKVHQDAGIANAVQFVLTALSKQTSIVPLTRECRRTDAVQPMFFKGNKKHASPLNVQDWTEDYGLGSLLKGDFDNDGDLDLYAVRESPLKDFPDLLLENTGNGQFLSRPVSVDYRYREDGVFVRELIPGPHAVVGDYDNNGFLDVFLAGRHYYSWLENPRLVPGTPNRLLSNVGNNNHWLKINLMGVDSNKDAIGAQVILRTAHKKMVRIQNGGMNGYDQNSKELHFGIGTEDIVGSIEVLWPSGNTSVLRGVKVDQMLHIEEAFSKKNLLKRTMP